MLALAILLYPGQQAQPFESGLTNSLGLFCLHWKRATDNCLLASRHVHIVELLQQERVSDFSGTLHTIMEEKSGNNTIEKLSRFVIGKQATKKEMGETALLKSIHSSVCCRRRLWCPQCHDSSSVFSRLKPFPITVAARTLSRIGSDCLWWKPPLTRSDIVFTLDATSRKAVSYYAMHMKTSY